MAVDRLIEEIQKLSQKQDIEASKQAADGWADIDAEKLIEDIYKKRSYSGARFYKKVLPIAVFSHDSLVEEQ